MTQRVRVLFSRPDDLGLIHRIHMVERENQLTQVVLWPHCESRDSCTYPKPIVKQLLTKIKVLNFIMYQYHKRLLLQRNQRCQELRSGLLSIFILFHLSPSSAWLIQLWIMILSSKTRFFQSWDWTKWPLPWKIWICTSFISLPLCCPYQLVGSICCFQKWN